MPRLGDAHHQGRLQAELPRLGRIPLLIGDEVGYIPFHGEAANLFSSSSRPATNGPRSSSPPTNPSVAGGEVFGDATVAAAMIDRLVHHAQVIFKGDSYRLKA